MTCRVDDEELQKKKEKKEHTSKIYALLSNY